MVENKQMKNYLVCGKNCFRYSKNPDAPKYAQFNCYLGSSSGISIRPGERCAWDYTLESKIDRGSPK
jgi:hypothetical protein